MLKEKEKIVRKIESVETWEYPSEDQMEIHSNYMISEGYTCILLIEYEHSIRCTYQRFGEGYVL